MSINTLAPQDQKLNHDQALSNEYGNLRIKHCTSCHREDFHYEVRQSSFLRGMLITMTFGLAYLLKPSRCICCGNLRIF